MKNQKGITLLSLVVYIAVLMIVIGIMTSISSNFYTNIEEVKQQPKYINEFNKFAMFFIQDIKNNTQIKSISENELQLEDGTTYKFLGNSIFRNSEEIAKEVQSLTFSSKEITVKSIQKTIIVVNLSIGEENEFNEELEFVLRYW